MPSIIPVEGDITRISAEAIVNAANSALGPGAGVNGAIHAAGGPAVLADTALWYPAGLGTGEAAWSTAGDLPARWVIHTVGPHHSAGQRDRALLVSAYRRSLEVADELGARTVSFPLLSSGIFGWPFQDAVRTALDAIGLARTDVREVYLVAHGEQAFEAVQRALQVSTPLRLLQGVRHAVRTGHRQLRFLPRAGPAGSSWHLDITTADNLRADRPEAFADPLEAGRVLSYSTADGPAVGDGEITAATTPAEAAALILRHLGNPPPEPGHEAHTRWAGSLLAAVERATAADGQGLPVAATDGQEQWELGRGSGRWHPGPPA